jgi:hypothetical protein
MGDDLLLIGQHPALIAGSQAVDEDTFGPWVLVGVDFIFNHKV